MSALLVILFTVGLFVRLIRWVREGGSRGRRQRTHAATRQEWAGREFADEVPVDRVARGGRSRRSETPFQKKG